jgi:Tfp pilus assembly protein PilE
MKLPIVAAVPLLIFTTTDLCAQSAPADSQFVAEAAVRSRLKSDLRNLVVAQEAYFANHSSYAASLEVLSKYRPSAGSQIRLVLTRENSWAATANDAATTGRSCTIWINVDNEQHRQRTRKEIRVGREGEPVCDGDSAESR